MVPKILSFAPRCEISFVVRYGFCLCGMLGCCADPWGWLNAAGRCSALLCLSLLFLFLVVRDTRLQLIQRQIALIGIDVVQHEIGSWRIRRTLCRHSIFSGFCKCMFDWESIPLSVLTGLWNRKVLLPRSVMVCADKAFGCIRSALF